LLDDFEQEQDEDDREDEAKASAPVIAESRSHTITAKAEHKNQDDQEDNHYSLSPYREDSLYGGVMRILSSTQWNLFFRGLPEWEEYFAGSGVSGKLIVA
jgi:hypothetical protein